MNVKHIDPSFTFTTLLVALEMEIDLNFTFGCRFSPKTHSKSNVKWVVIVYIVILLIVNEHATVLMCHCHFRL